MVPRTRKSKEARQAGKRTRDNERNRCSYARCSGGAPAPAAVASKRVVRCATPSADARARRMMDASNSKRPPRAALGPSPSYGQGGHSIDRADRVVSDVRVHPPAPKSSSVYPASFVAACLRSSVTTPQTHDVTRAASGHGTTHPPHSPPHPHPSSPNPINKQAAGCGTTGREQQESRGRWWNRPAAGIDRS